MESYVRSAFCCVVCPESSTCNGRHFPNAKHRGTGESSRPPLFLALFPTQQNRIWAAYVHSLCSPMFAYVHTAHPIWPFARSPAASNRVPEYDPTARPATGPMCGYGFCGRAVRPAVRFGRSKWPCSAYVHPMFTPYVHLCSPMFTRENLVLHKLFEKKITDLFSSLLGSI